MKSKRARNGPRTLTDDIRNTMRMPSSRPKQDTTPYLASIMNSS
ncbi:unnamed protein product, partial [Rotaria magnacalcarata]